jgi:hypothetical protein
MLRRGFGGWVGGRMVRCQGRSVVRLPTFAGRKRPTARLVLPAVLDAVAALPESVGAPWRAVNAASFVQVDDQRVCANLATLARTYLVRMHSPRCRRLHRAQAL